MSAMTEPYTMEQEGLLLASDVNRFNYNDVTKYPPPSRLIL